MTPERSFRAGDRVAFLPSTAGLVSIHKDCLHTVIKLNDRHVPVFEDSAGTVSEVRSVVGWFRLKPISVELNVRVEPAVDVLSDLQELFRIEKELDSLVLKRDDLRARLRVASPDALLDSVSQFVKGT